MGHRPLYKKSSNCGIAILLATALAIGGVYYLFNQWLMFNPQKIVAESVLRDKTFAPSVQEITAPQSKIKAYLFEERSNPIVSVSLMFVGSGWAADSKDQQGLANMAAAMLGEGAGKLSSQQWKEELENNAIAIGFDAGKDDFAISLLTTKENAPRAFELLKLALLEARFDEVDLQRVKAQMQEALRRQREHPANALALDFAKAMYGEHPYGRNRLGEAKAIAAAGRSDLQQFARDNFSRSNLVVGLAGDLTVAEAEKMLDEMLGALPATGKQNPVLPAELTFNGQMQRVAQKTGQNIAVFAAPSVGRNDPDFYPLFVANYVVGGSGLSSRLSKAIREDQGLTYGVYSYLGMDDKAPLLQAGFSTTADNYEQALAEFRKQWQAFGDRGIEASELRRAKDYLTASYNLRFASIGNIAEMMAAMQRYQLGLDFLQKRNSYVEAVTVEQVDAAAKKYFNNQKLFGMAIGSFKD